MLLEVVSSGRFSLALRHTGASAPPIHEFSDSMARLDLPGLHYLKRGIGDDLGVTLVLAALTDEHDDRVVLHSNAAGDRFAVDVELGCGSRPGLLELLKLALFHKARVRISYTVDDHRGIDFRADAAFSDAATMFLKQVSEGATRMVFEHAKVDVEIMGPE